MRVPWLVLSFAPLFAGCSLFGGVPSFTCPSGTHPCGDGCIPTLAVCCDDGSQKTSSYCTNGATGCFPNTDARCNAVFPMGVVAQFCCGESGTIGTNDCPEGQHHCGTLCQPSNVPCCPAGSSERDCPERSWNNAGCQTEPGRVGCGVCVDKKACVSCGPGWCCQGGLVCGGQGAHCVQGPSCTGLSGGAGSGGGSGSSDCSKYSQNVCGTSGGIQSLGAYFPPTCACPSGTREAAGRHVNELCGLPGDGYECKYCECT